MTISINQVLYEETVRVTVGLDGSVKFVTENGTFEVGVEKLKLLQALLGANGLDITPSDEYESHRHDEAHEHVYQLAHQ